MAVTILQRLGTIKAPFARKARQNEKRRQRLLEGREIIMRLELGIR